MPGEWNIFGRRDRPAKAGVSAATHHTVAITETPMEFTAIASVIIAVIALVGSLFQWHSSQSQNYLLGRATVVMDNVEFFADTSKYTTVHYQMKNVGATVADNITLTAEIVLRRRPVGANDDAFSKAAEHSLARVKLISPWQSIPLAPQQTHVVKFEGDDQLSPAQVDDILHFKLRVYIFGRVYYTDFQKNKRHTDFCSFINGTVEEKAKSLNEPGFCESRNVFDSTEPLSKK